MINVAISAEMVLSYEDKVLIKNLHLSKGYGARKLMSEFPDKNWKRSSLDKLLKKIQQTWRNINQSITANATDERRKRLRACVHGNGGH